MDILVSAIVGDLVGRSTSFVIGKYFRQQPGIDEILQRLHRVVPRIDTVVEESEGWHITNHGMLRQLKMLGQEMYRGHYVLDALRFQSALDGEEVSHSLTAAAALSKSSSSPAKRLRFSVRGGGGGNSSREAAGLSMFGANGSIQEELQRVVDALEDTMDAGMKEFLSFLESYPRRVLRQPRCAYLLLENCMFGRQTERERVLDFLLRPSGTSATPSLHVLPIVGPLRVGKTTLVEHVCRDESVRHHFSTILFFPEGSLGDEGVIDLRGSSSFLVRHQNSSSSRSHGGRLLVIADNIDEGAWRRLKPSVTCMAPAGGSKIILTSRSDRIVNLGTTEALRLHHVPPDAHWYFFKSLAFGSTDPAEHPNLAAMAMEIASEQRQCLMSAHIVAGALRDNFDARLWRAILEFVRAYRKMHDKRPNIWLLEDEPRPLCHWRLGRSCQYFLICKLHQLESSQEVPKISVQDIILGRGGRLPRGEFQALSLRSCIPPYYNYTVSCMMPAPQPAVGRKKRVIQEEGHLV